MRILDQLNSRGWAIRLSFKFWGCPNLTKDPHKLALIQDQVFEDPKMAAQILSDGTLVTHCNQAAHAVARAYGCLAFLDLKTNLPYLADEIYEILGSSKDFLLKPMEDCQTLANQGVLIFAALPSIRLGEQHGHIASVTPGLEQSSGTWNSDHVPVVMNIGGKTTSFRARGANWAFPVEKGRPEFFAWVPSL